MLRLLIALLLTVASVTAIADDHLQTENIILFTADGLRNQEMFAGLDQIILDAPDKAGVQNMSRLKETYWRDTPEERREILMPFFWGELIQHGSIVGNTVKKSEVLVTNGHNFSYPGYSEILTGAPHPDVNSNGKSRNPRLTVLEVVRAELNLGYKGVAAFGSWDVFNWIVSKEEDPFYTNAGYEAVPENLLVKGMEPLNTWQFEMLTPWDSVRFDTVTYGLAKAYLKAHKPRLLYIALGETDDWAHNRRYDRYIHGIKLWDDALRDLWETLQSMRQYKDKTTIILTTDHGRGGTPEDWTSHGGDVPGAEHIWIAVIGPDTPNHGELSNTPAYTQAQVASTIAKLFGVDYLSANPDAARPLEFATGE